MAEDPTRGFANNVEHGRTIYLNLLRPLSTPMLVKEYDILMRGLIAQAPPDFLEAFGKLVRESARKTPEA